jgi:hypothetical protein
VQLELCLHITLTITETTRHLEILADDTATVYTAYILSGEIAAESNPCGEMTFLAEDFTVDESDEAITITLGNAAVGPGECLEGERQPCCTDCCDTVGGDGTGSGPVPETNEVAGVCCAYLTYTEDGNPVSTPVGMSGTWGPKGAPGLLPVGSVQSVCGRAYYLDWLEADSPECHEHITTAKRSIVMTLPYAVVEVFLDDNCCPESIQVLHTIDPPQSAGYALNFGPVVIENYFSDGVNEYDLYVCQNAPQGACCLPGNVYFGQTTQYQCEVIGDGIDTGTWTEGETECP